MKFCRNESIFDYFISASLFPVSSSVEGQREFRLCDQSNYLNVFSLSFSEQNFSDWRCKNEIRLVSMIQIHMEIFSRSSFRKRFKMRTFFFKVWSIFSCFHHIHRDENLLPTSIKNRKNKFSRIKCAASIDYK